ncbi:Glycosyltransferase involved in cell wall bisynthesis [Candidatus Kryptonium thompsonii]|uniref:Glycosyltransferase involved in cell wall bisynthesis n=1 Tax=Candidatus Kryptonium thompsonii TaxID=1633631 RepID=A0A0P1LY37_9BACT|nr:glycosyltransferase [Candidatus Kryptonium thompsoni]CUS80113.1 Glycosyltransferase involved in cell wall bisynthesis [Candidatus Kryptonium thompsoni]CUS82411.1 Glycosyltransferase involved in cell wall bisynthesis [Candidatus Kryptonium thompsoni]CUS82995.1 Glycosyltransferase involved in cell wall bisynthesis [Candidatus Kryptonium thompsoni]CUS84664.1 Glycosyltransferase involved in cell wall bisynthesis [Candidatus Kryptonium thompsoni]CUS86826.1 Glycosyltransferase involved in cell wa
MKIIIVGPVYPYRGGIAHYIKLLYKSLIRNNHDVKIFNFKRLYPNFLFPGKTQFEKSDEVEKIESKRIIDSVNPISWFTTGFKIAKEKPDIVIFKYWLPFFAPCFGITAGIIKLLSNSKIIFICDNITPHEKFPLSKPLSKFAFLFVDHFIVQSTSVEEDLLKIKPRASYKKVFHPIYEIFGKPIDRNEARKLLGIRPDEKILLFFGYIRGYKGLDLLLKSMKLVLSKFPVKLLVAGEFYEDPKRYYKIVEEEGIADFVIFKSEYIPNDEVKVYFCASDLVVLPYISATQSGIVQIAYNFNKPVIATNVGGLPEVVIDGETGFVVEPSSEKLAEAIIKFFEWDLAETFSKNIENVKEKFSWEHLVQILEELSSK